jgi:hypothetical protein
VAADKAAIAVKGEAKVKVAVKHRCRAAPRIRELS